MNYHPNDADERLAQMMQERREHEHSEWFATLPLEEQIAWLQKAGKDAAAAMARSIAQREETR